MVASSIIWSWSRASHDRKMNNLCLGRNCVFMVERSKTSSRTHRSGLSDPFLTWREKGGFRIIKADSLDSLPRLRFKINFFSWDSVQTLIHTSLTLVFERRWRVILFVTHCCTSWRDFFRAAPSRVARVAKVAKVGPKRWVIDMTNSKTLRYLKYLRR